MKNILIVLCTPDMHRPVAKECIERIKATNLDEAELLIIDNAYDTNFRHPVTMESFLKYADDRSVIFLDDDVYINDKDWIRKLTGTAQASGAAIVGCVHTFDSGEVNHAGVLVYKEASTELLRAPISESEHFCYAPALSSAVLLVTTPQHFSFDTAYNKYQHDTDICLQAWEKGFKVACALNLNVIHIQGQYMSIQANFRNIFAEDDFILQKKWQEFVRQDLYKILELKPYASLAEATNWEKFYNSATLLATSDPLKAAGMFRQIIATCPYAWRVGSAYYHLYKIEGEHDHLEACVKLYPAHVKARLELQQFADGEKQI